MNNYCLMWTESYVLFDQELDLYRMSQVIGKTLVEIMKI